MGRQLIIILLVIFTLSPAAYSQDRGNDNRLRDIIRIYGQAQVTVPFTDYKMLDNLSKNVSVTGVRDNIIEITLSHLTVEWFLRERFNYSVQEPKSRKELLVPSTSVEKAFQWDTYPTYLQYDSIMRAFTEEYPTLCLLDTIGKSINGRLVLALRISGNSPGTYIKPAVFYTSTMHGDETGGFIMMLRLAAYLLSNYNDNNRVKELVDNLEIWINPLANPDGTYYSGDTIISPVRFNAEGVDLNRDFPDPNLPNLVLQKENIDMIRFMGKHKFILSANFHSGSEVVNYPWDRWLYKLHADDAWFNEISRAYADTAHIYAGSGYMNDLDNGVTRGALWYVVYGGRQDFTTQDLHGREVTIELDNQYITPASQLPWLWENNWRSLLGYLENALYGIHGGVFDSGTFLPVAAMVFIKEHDVDSSQVYSDTLSGYFVRMLSPGNWELTLTAKGYRDTTITVLVNGRQKTDISVYMEKGQVSHDTSEIRSPALYPNPAGSYIKALLPEEVTGRVNVMIISHSGQVLKSYDADSFKDVPLLIDTGSLPSGVFNAVFANNKRHTSCRGRFIIIK